MFQVPCIPLKLLWKTGVPVTTLRLQCYLSFLPKKMTVLFSDARFGTVRFQKARNLSALWHSVLTVSTDFFVFNLILRYLWLFPACVFLWRSSLATSPLCQDSFQAAKLYALKIIISFLMHFYCSLIIPNARFYFDDIINQLSLSALLPSLRTNELRNL